MADPLGFGSFGQFGAPSIASQQRALQRQAAMAANAPPMKPGELFAQFLGERGAENTLRRREEAEARTMNSIQQQYLQEMEASGKPVDLMQAQSEIILRAANQFAQQGNHARARELYQQAAQMQQQYAVQQAELDKIRSETAENLRVTPEKPPEFVQLQNARDSLREFLGRITSGEARGDAKLVREKIDEITDRIKSIIEGRSTDYQGYTTGTRTQLDAALVGYQDQLIRLYDVQDAFEGNEDLLRPGGKFDVLVAMGKDFFNSATPADQQLIDDWTDLKQSAMQQVNLVLKELSGAAVSNQEYDRQLAVELNPGTLANPFSGDKPREFRRKLHNKIRWAEAAVKRYNALITEGRLNQGEAITEELAQEYPLTMYGAEDDSKPRTLDDMIAEYEAKLAEEEANSGR